MKLACTTIYYFYLMILLTYLMILLTGSSEVPLESWRSTEPPAANADVEAHVMALVPDTKVFLSSLFKGGFSQ
jgi:hypothetical protein